MTAPTDRAEVRKLAAAIEEALTQTEEPPTAFRDETDPPRFGPAPPVPQPGRPPMSQKAVDDSVRMLCGSALTLAVGGAGTGLLWASGHANPYVVAAICAGPPALALAFSRVVRRFREAVAAAPAEQHHHYTGTVHQDLRTSHTSGVWARTNNQ